MERGYVKLWRKTLDSGLMQNDNAFRLFGYLLMNVAFTEKKVSSDGQITVLHPGQAIFSRKRIADFLMISEQNARTALKFLEKLEILTSKPTNRFTVISFVNWDTYQNEKIATNQQTNQQLTNSSPTVNQQVTTVLECKNVRMEECKNINTTPLTPQGEPVGKKSKREPTGNSKAELQAQIDAYTPNEELRQSLKSWLVMRDKIRKPLTGDALKKNLRTLNGLATSDEMKIQIVDQTLMNSWAGFFELKQQSLIRPKPWEVKQQQEIDRYQKLCEEVGW